jgi:multicomponent Na+:H+ antiporter subunit C
MTSGPIFALCATGLVGIGVYGFIAHRNLVRRILAFNLIGSGIFLMFGGLTSGAAAESADPVPQAMVITGIVVALAATALAVTLSARLFDVTGRPFMPEEESLPSQERESTGDAGGG